MNLVDEKHVAFLQVCENRCEVTGLFKYGARGDMNLCSHFRRNNMRKGGLAETWRAKEQNVIKGFPTITGSMDEDSKIRHQALLPDELFEAFGTKSLFDRLFVCAANGI